MEQIRVNELKIANVTHTDLEHRLEKFRIEFFIDGFEYYLYMEEFKDGKLHPTSIVHLDEGSDCTYCKSSSFICPQLSEYKQEIFHRLIEFSSIRLKWLYIDHV